jgi:hypothetical protein
MTNAGMRQIYSMACLGCVLQLDLLGHVHPRVGVYFLVGFVAFRIQPLAIATQRGYGEPSDFIL